MVGSTAASASTRNRTNRLVPSSLLVLGTVLGLSLAAAGLLAAPQRVGGHLAENVVATVNGHVIRYAEYNRVLNGLAQDLRDAPNETQRRHVLDRLIDEELLVQRGLELDIARDDSRVRKDLTAAVIDSVVAEFDDAQPGDEDLQRFYAAHRDFFTVGGRVRVRQVFCRVASDSDAPSAAARAQQAATRLRAGEEFTTVRDTVGDNEPAPLPDTPLPPAKLVDYLGPTAAHTAMTLPAGGVSDPVRSNSGLHVLQLMERQADVIPPLDEIKPQVLAEFRRRGSEQALRTYLDELRARAEVIISPHIP